MIWGFIHWLFLAVEEFIPDLQPGSIFRYVRQYITFAIVCLAWVFFRAKTFHNAIAVLRDLVQIPAQPLHQLHQLLVSTYATDLFAYYLFAVLCLFLFIDFICRQTTFELMVDKLAAPLRRSIYFIIVFLIIFFGFKEGAPVFIYFKF